MALILSLETSTKVCSVAIHKDGNLLSVYEFRVERSHSKLITQAISFLMEGLDLKMSDLDAIAVSKGPGSYTGLRIGVSTAKGLCYGLDKPLIAVDTLEAMARKVNKYNLRNSLICPMIDARRLEVYCALYNKENETIFPVSAVILNEFSFSNFLNSSEIIFLGDGAGKFAPLVAARCNAIFLQNENPSAEYVGIIAEEKYLEGLFEDVAYFEPFYLKDFISTGSTQN
ncbi:tRNA (adenosine(37)-N6)-threonylcarbamoyltransferase complex dimerization subunit type 1 TsaB [Sporocytophaga myxococcoides]|uniref:tRNA (adenosine(37)-N6)-threonylcarbamoyltransferase complex dimerization subunit type 1 TsaB n=1 Tax=Sporocytophaga myxococcoides TaxID=153721 RepID=UPI00048B4B0F|nr:tRNA (adenosine(37)-N6)-threonylcarbamoyltransferase complex dimerization subunit type 1 TsaB [Sporocytophaga myxococcoides]